MAYNSHKQLWFNPNIEYIFDTTIIEYDIADAGFSIIKEYRLLPRQKIMELEMLGKGIERHIAIGKLQGSDKVFSSKFTEKFAEIRSVFVNSNDLTDNDILSVKKDAIFTTKKCYNVEFGNIRFVEKNVYSSYIRFSNINNIEIYYSNDLFDIKNIGESSANKHRLFMLDTIKSIISMIENKDQRVKRFINDFIKKYKSHQLDDEYYIKFDSASKDIDLLFNFKNVIIPLVTIICKEVPYE